ncbi:hypothetical protein V6Z12_A09G155900 [Gossypium hirsutum]|uniref:Uncharacterized protein n=1 Tax=Gossypium tomentosum TaxID=34277 RepID=A0A5D2P5P7_GOSTO|nr:hypothetical protein ES332_A09G160100v1 [Gossypium tomentosum]
MWGRFSQVLLLCKILALIWKLAGSSNVGLMGQKLNDQGELSRVMFSKHNLEDRPGEVDDGKKRARVALGATSASDTVDSSVFGIDHVMSVDHPVSEDCELCQSGPMKLLC